MPLGLRKKRRRLSSAQELKRADAVRDQGVAISQPTARVMAARKKLFVLVQILFQYLERVDPEQLRLAKLVRHLRSVPLI